MARTDPQVNIRMPDALVERLRAAAQSNGQTLAAEIIARLESTFPADFSEMVILSLQVDIERYQQQIADLRSYLQDRGDSMSEAEKAEAGRLISRAEENFRRTADELDAITLKPGAPARQLGFK